MTIQKLNISYLAGGQSGFVTLPTFAVVKKLKTKPILRLRSGQVYFVLRDAWCVLRK